MVSSWAVGQLGSSHVPVMVHSLPFLYSEATQRRELLEQEESTKTEEREKAEAQTVSWFGSVQFGLSFNFFSKRFRSLTLSNRTTSLLPIVTDYSKQTGLQCG
mgnify:CR=1 FL=1